MVKQVWEINQEVQVGFLTLKITAHNKEDNIYSLVSLDGSKEYAFKPYEGLQRTNAPIYL